MILGTDKKKKQKNQQTTDKTLIPVVFDFKLLKGYCQVMHIQYLAYF